MKKIQCEMCGSNDLLKIDGVYMCQSCGTKFTIEEAKKLMIEFDGPIDIKGTVTVDNKNHIDNLKKLAEIDIEKDGFGNALKYYESIIIEEPTNWKAHFYIPYIKAWSSKYDELETVINRFNENFNTVFEMIKNNTADENKEEAIKVVYDKSIKLFEMVKRAVDVIYKDELDWQPRISAKPDITEMYEARCKKKNHDAKAEKEMCDKTKEVCKIFSALGDTVDLFFKDDSSMNIFAVNAWKKYVEELSNISAQDPEAKQKVEEYSDIIKRFEPEYVIPISINEKTSKQKDDKSNENRGVAILILCLMIFFFLIWMIGFLYNNSLFSKSNHYSKSYIKETTVSEEGNITDTLQHEFSFQAVNNESTTTNDSISEKNPKDSGKQLETSFQLYEVTTDEYWQIKV